MSACIHVHIVRMIKLTLELECATFWLRYSHKHAISESVVLTGCTCRKESVR